jgi:hypothetical protein
MSADKEDTRLLLLVGLAIALFAYIGGYKMAKDHFDGKNGMVTDTLIVEHWDTVKIVEPHEVVRYVQRYDTIRLTDEPRIVITIDSTAIIPIEQAVYQDSTDNAQYTAYVSGFRAELDSIQINCKNTETIITNTIETKPRRFGVGIQLGVGVSPQGVAAPYVGVGVHYRLW